MAQWVGNDGYFCTEKWKLLFSKNFLVISITPVRKTHIILNICQRQSYRCILRSLAALAQLISNTIHIW